MDEIVGDDVAESPDHLVVAKDDFDLDNEDGGEIMEENQNQEMYENQEIADVPVMREEFTAQPEKKAKKDKYDNTFPAGALFFPWARVKKIIRADMEVKTVSSDAIFCMGKACEMFTQYYAAEGYKVTRMDKRKTLTNSDLERAVKRSVDQTKDMNLQFLEGVQPDFSKKLKKDVES